MALHGNKFSETDRRMWRQGIYLNSACNCRGYCPSRLSSALSKSDFINVLLHYGLISRPYTRLLTVLVSAVTAGGERSGGSAPPRSLLGLGGAGEALPPLIILGCLNRQREPSPPHPTPSPPPVPLCSSRLRARTRARGSAESTRLLLAGVTVRAPTPSLSLSLSPRLALSFLRGSSCDCPGTDCWQRRWETEQTSAKIRNPEGRSPEPADSAEYLKKGEYDPCGGEGGEGLFCSSKLVSHNGRLCP